MSSSAAGRPVLVANLDCETTWARAAAIIAGREVPAPVRGGVRDRISPWASLMRALIADDDATLLVPGDLPADAIGADTDGILARPTIATYEYTGPQFTERAPILAWGSEPGLWVRRDEPTEAQLSAEPIDWIRQLWRLPLIHPRIARTVAARDWQRIAAADCAATLPGEQSVATMDEVAATIGRLAAEHPAGWVAKANRAAAGRDRVRGRDASLDETTRERLATLLRHHGSLLIEPWLERSLDLGWLGLLDPTGRVTPLGSHRILVDERGQFLGIHVPPGDDALGLSAEENQSLTTAATTAAAHLARAGYVGPFGIDAFRHSAGFHPFVECNPRLTFGFIARAIRDRLRHAGALDPSETLQLREVPPTPPASDDPAATGTPPDLTTLSEYAPAGTLPPAAARARWTLITGTPTRSALVAEAYLA